MISKYSVSKIDLLKIAGNIIYKIVKLGAKEYFRKYPKFSNIKNMEDKK